MAKHDSTREPAGFGHAGRVGSASTRYGARLSARIASVGVSPVTVRHTVPRAPLDRATIAARHRAADVR